MGWGILDYFVETTRPFHIIGAFFANQQALHLATSEKSNIQRTHYLNRDVVALLWRSSL
jgi:hypothetical protein